jgi:hypothetical protein
MRAIPARFGVLMAMAVSICWAQPSITSLQSSTFQSDSPSNVTAITSGTPLQNGGFELFINGAFLNMFQNVTWKNTSTGVSTVFATNVAITSTQLIVNIPNALFATVVTSPVTVNVTVQDNTGISNIAIFTINPPMKSLGPVLASGTLNQNYPDTPFVTGGTAPYSFGGFTGSVPPGTDIDAAATGVLGLPAQSGLFNFIPTVGDFWGNSLSPGITIEVVDVPTLISILPASASAGSAATTIALTGTNFVGPQQVGNATIPGTTAQWATFGSAPVPLATLPANAGVLSVVIPANLMLVPVVASITVIQPSGVFSNALSFTVIGPTSTSAPQYSPASTVVAGTPVTMSVTVAGVGSIPGTVAFSEAGNPIGAAKVSNLSASFTTSTLSPGVHNILATYSGDPTHTGSVSATSALTIVALATVSTISPASAPAGSPAVTLTVNGTNFVPGSVVTFNRQQLATTYISPLQVTAIIPSALLLNAGSATVLVVNPGGAGSSAPQLFSVLPSLLLNTTGLPTGTAGAFYSATLSASGGVPPYTWSTSGLPVALSSNSATGVISGMALASGTFPVSLVVKDAVNATASRTLSLTVNSPPVQLTTPGGGLPNGTVNVAYAAYLSASGGASPYIYSIQGGSLPAGLSMADYGYISGTPKTPGVFPFGVQVTDTNGVNTSGQFSITILPGPLTLSGGGSGTVGTQLSIAFSGSGGVPPYTFSISGSLPPGTAASGATLSGTPTTAGSYTLRVVLADSTGATVTQSVSIVIAVAPVSLTIGGSLGNGQVGVLYSGQLTAAGGTPPYTFTGTGLPAGLGLSKSGAISGTPSTAGDFIVSATVTDATLGTVPHTASGRFPITIAPAVPALTVTTSSLPNGVVNVAYAASLAASGGAAPYTWTLTGLPAGVTASSAGVLSGAPTTAGNYTVKASVVDAAGMTAAQSYQITVAPPPLVITTASAPSATVGTPYTVNLVATGGVAPYTWTATGLPAGLAISTAGAITGTPAAPGSATLAVTVKDSAGTSTSKSLSLAIGLPAAPPLNVTGISATSAPLQQPVVQVSLGNTYPVDVAVTLTLTFAADSGADDPTIQFSTGGRVAHITVPAGSTNGLSTAGVQTGSVAGLITITANMQAASLDVTPSPAPTRTIRIAALAPAVTTVTATRNSTGFTVTMIGYVTDREITQAIFTFTPAAGANLQTTTLTVPVSSIFTTYFSGSSAAPFGGQFNFTETFTVTGSTQAITAVSVTLVNNVGQSTAGSATVN